MFNVNDHLVNVMMIDCNLWISRQASLPHQYGVGKAGGRSPIEMATKQSPPRHPNKDGRATDSCFALVGAHHQCGVLMVG